MTDETKQAYYSIITACWRGLKKYGADIENISSASDSMWKEITEYFDTIERTAPDALKRYAGDMVLLHVSELENMWRSRTEGH